MLPKSVSITLSAGPADVACADKQNGEQEARNRCEDKADEIGDR